MNRASLPLLGIDRKGNVWIESGESLDYNVVTSWGMTRASERMILLGEDGRQGVCKVKGWVDLKGQKAGNSMSKCRPTLLLVVSKRAEGLTKKILTSTRRLQ